MPPDDKPNRSVFADANVALATVLCAAAAALGHPQIAWPICTMVAAVYGLPKGVEMLIKRVGESRNAS